MLTKIHPILSLLLSLALISIISAQAHPQPDQIIEVFRHGARGPLSGYDHSWPNHEFGVLTASGTRQHYVLGKALAKKYPNIFNKAYNPFSVYVLSDLTIRCIQSASAHLDGLFEGKGLSLRENFAPGIAVPPFMDPVVQETVSSIPHASALPSNRVPTIVNVVDSSNTAIFQRNRGLTCPNGVKWEVQNAWDNKTKEAWEIFKPTIEKMNSYLGPKQQIRGNLDVAAFGDAMLVNIYDNRTLPGNMSDPDLIANFTSAFSWFVFHVEYGQLTQRQLSAYHTVEAMINQLMAFRRGVGYHQAAMFSGHDYNLYALLAAFGVVTEECLMENFLSFAANKTVPHPTCVFPHFAANIILEFYNHTTNPQVKFLYNNMIIPLCNGKETCDYEEFLFVARNATGNNTIASFQEQCGVNVTTTSVHEVPSQEELLLENQKSAAEQLITGENNNDSLVTDQETVAAKPKMIESSNNFLNSFLKIALIGMTFLCILLAARLISSHREFYILEEEVRGMKSDFGGEDMVAKNMSTQGDINVLKV